MRLAVTASIPHTMFAISSRAKRTSSSTGPCCSAVPRARRQHHETGQTAPFGAAVLYIVKRSGTGRLRPGLDRIDDRAPPNTS